jgi:hypothetical protein
MVSSGMPDKIDQRLATEIFNLFQYLGRLREEIASIARQPESETAFEGVSGGFHMGNPGLDYAVPRKWTFAGMKTIDCSCSI